ncbi:MAG: hypothetical protein QM586_07570 [Xenophilus sp.]
MNAPSSRPRGIALIELLVGLTVGLLVVAAALGTLAASRGASAAASDVAQLQQQAAYALRVIGEQLRQAGAVEPVYGEPNQRFSFKAGDAGTSAVSGSEGGAAADVLNTSAAASTLPVATRPRDCLGNVVTGVVENQFSLRGGELFCQGSTGTPQALIQNVADFQVLYRVKSGTGMRVMDAGAVASAQRWSGVVAVEVCLDMQGTEVLPDADIHYIDCQGASRRRDGHAHLVYRNVYNIRPGGEAS